jgi:hypothetical protein
MVDNDLQNMINYRQEVLSRLFDYVKSGESFYVIGAPSVGKTRLMDFLMGDIAPVELGANTEFDRDGVKRHYLGDDLALQTWLIRIDLNRIGQGLDWSFHFYELMLSAILFDCSKHQKTDQVKEMEAMLAGLDSQVLNSKDPLMAHRLFEMAVNKLCQTYQIKLCFLFDEFDETYKNMPGEIFAQLRAIRDANKYRVSYAMFLRNLPENLRPPTENEGFYELLSRNMIGIGPFTRQDSLRVVIRQLEERKNYPLSPETRDWLYYVSGGHPGLIHALFSILKDNPQALQQTSNLEWYATQESVGEEFRKIWNGLMDNEKAGLLIFARGNPKEISPQTSKMLYAKGLLQQTANSTKYFSPLFGFYLKQL